ncbi:MAG: autoinducer binding domain-containing protein [Rhizobiaceae bacterium]
MFNVKVFASFNAPSSATNLDRQYLEVLKSIRKNTAAKYVNSAIYSLKSEQAMSMHFLTYPMEWITHYIRQFYSEIDPLLSTNFNRTGMIDWRDLYCDEKTGEILTSFREFGLGRNALTIVGSMGDSQYCALSLTFDVGDGEWSAHVEQNRDVFRFEADRAGELYHEIFENRPRRDFRLTRREREVLRLVALGRTDDQIAELIGIGKWTVVGHLQSARFKLGSSNRASTVAQAIVAGIIDLSDAI